MSDETDDGPDESAADAPADAGEDEPESPSDAIGESDFVKLAYTARSVENGTLVDTTDPDVAEEEGVDVEQQTFEPRIIGIGAGHIFPSVEDDIEGKSVGDTGTVEVPPEEAFGDYDPEQVRTVSADTLPEDDRYPGAHVEVDGQQGVVETVIGGRARVDFNHMLAGETIEYEYEILDVIEDRIEQAQGILGAVVDADLEMWTETEEVEQEVPPEPEADDEEAEDDEEPDEEAEPETEVVEVETLYIESVPQLSMNQQWMFQKQQIAQELIERVGVDRVIVQETLEGLGGLGGMGDIQGLLDDVEVDADEVAEELDDLDDLDEDLDLEDVDVEE